MVGATLRIFWMLIHLLHTSTPTRLVLLVIPLYKEQVAQGHTTNKWWNWGSHSGSLNSELEL